MDIKKCTIHKRNYDECCYNAANNTPDENRRTRLSTKPKRMQGGVTPIDCIENRYVRCSSPSPTRICKKIEKCTTTSDENVRVRFQDCYKEEDNEPSKCHNTTRIPDKCITSEKWKRRNDSHQVSAAMQTNIYEDTDSEGECATKVRTTTSKIKWTKPMKISRFHNKCITPEKYKKKRWKKPRRNIITSKHDSENYIVLLPTEYQRSINECYCKKLPCRPTLLCQPQEKVCKKTQCTQCAFNCRYESIPVCYSDETLEIASELINYCPESEFLKRIHKGVQKVSDCPCDECCKQKWRECLEYTDRRAKIERAYKELEEEQRSYEACDHNYEIACSTEANYDEDSTDSTISCNDDVNVGQVCYRVHSASSIRRDNFFDTHNTDDLTCNYVPEHRCVHKYKLDDRCLPVAVNTDCYGTSRCSICDKPVQRLRKVCSDITMNTSTHNCTCTSKEPKMTQTSACSNLDDVCSIYNSQECLKCIPKNKCSVKVNECSKINLDTLKTSIKSHPTKRNNKKKVTIYSDEKFNKIKKSFDKNKPCKKCYDAATCPSVSCHSFSPKITTKRKINIGSNADTIDFNVNTNTCNENTGTSEKYFLESVTMKVKPSVIPNNSLALRYQKGVV